MAGISTPGIGSGLDVNSIVTKLMNVEAQPLTTLSTKEAKFQAQLTAYGTVSGGLTSFQTALSGLTTPAKFQQLSSSVGDSSILTASADSNATAGSYTLNVSQLAQAQTLRTSGRTSLTTPIGAGTSTTLSFQFGTIAGGSFVKSGTTLAQSVATNGIAAGSLNINGTYISTSAATNSAKALAAAINLKTATTGVTATAAATVTAAQGAFTDVTTDVGDSYTLSVGGVTVANIGASSALTGADLDTALSDMTGGAPGALLAAAGITHTGSAVGGDLVFTRADGSNIDITQTLTGTATGGFAGLTSGITQTTLSSISLASEDHINVAGTTPTLAGLDAGAATYTGASFTQDANQTSGTVTIDSTNNSLQGIRDAINKAKIGVTASIVSDGTSSPYHLVLTSNKTGATSSMKITVSGDTDLQNLLGYDATSLAGQKMTESSAGQDTQLTVNGIFVSSATKSVSEAIQGVTINALKVGTTSLSISRDTSSISKAVDAFVKGYNDLNDSLKTLTAYDSTNKTGGVLLGDATVRSIQTGLRRMLSSGIPELSGNTLKSLTDIGVAFQKDGSLKVDSTKLQKAISTNVDEIAALFASFGSSTDSLVSVAGSTAATKAGSYAVSITSAATKGSATGNVVLNAGNTVIPANASLSVTLDGKSSTVPLVAGTYTGDALATMIQSAINGVSTFSTLGSSVKAVIDGSGYLSITSNRYGSTSKVTINSGTNLTADTLMGAAPTLVTGTDVVGTIGGQPATGSGQYLTGNGGGGANGLKLKIEDAASGGTVKFSQGYAYQLNSLVTSFLETNGVLTSRTKGINSSITEIGKQRDRLNERLTQTEKRYRAQFSALDTAIAQMNSTSTYLTQQLAAIAKQTG